MLESSRMDMCELTPEQCTWSRSRFRNWYIADLVYGLGTLYFFIGVIAACMISFWAPRLVTGSSSKCSSWRKLLGAFRYLAYRRYRVAGYLTPSVGVVLLLASGALFFLAMTLGPGPYYWPDIIYGSSPPIATRAGWMALACLPFILILSTKANMIANLTGVSHEKLIIFHNWTGWAMFVLSLGDMVMQWNMSIFYWSGVVALIAQAYLQFMSLSFIRNRFYEFFKATHLLAALIFVLFLFFHCDYTLTSCSPSTPQALFHRRRGALHPVLPVLPDPDLRRVRLRPARDLRPGLGPHPAHHRAGADHVAAGAAHVPALRGAAGARPHVAPLHRLQRPRCGVAQRRRVIESSLLRPGPQGRHGPPGQDGGRPRRVHGAGPDRRAVWRDQGKPLSSYDDNLIVACGAGAPFSLGLVMDALLLRRAFASKAEAGVVSLPRVEVLIATRDRQFVQWYCEALTDFMESNGLPLDLQGIRISVFQTGGGSNSSTAVSTASTTQDNEAEIKGRKSRSYPAPRQSLQIETRTGRPDIGATVREVTRRPGTSLAVVACGPGGVVEEVQAAAAEAQLRILGSRNEGAREVYLHTEHFS
ncbi:ferric reductase like transmembrane component-domain-containing protein [Apiospora phragmitis]|uniref:Ferric reductase like transmembrane component-domain-containing protein n=1 Tax=Apiospora phragmitis TaxID=2905665 RepID=A0ABR1US29_9PEZI